MVAFDGLSSGITDRVENDQLPSVRGEDRVELRKESDA